MAGPSNPRKQPLAAPARAASALGPARAPARRRRRRAGPRTVSGRIFAEAGYLDAEIACLVTCEHGGNRVPLEHAHLFTGMEDALSGHRGWDPGALDVARELASSLMCDLFGASVTRLLVDLNRSEGRPDLFSEATRDLPPAAREEILHFYYRPHRRRVRERVAGLLAAGTPALHIAAHSFTPVLAGLERKADVGLLYDPARRAEAHFCGLWREALLALAPELRVRRNYPYKGVSDGLAASLRREFGQGYAGVELEVNQKHALAGGAGWKRLCRALAESARKALERLAAGQG